MAASVIRGHAFRRGCATSYTWRALTSAIFFGYGHVAILASSRPRRLARSDVAHARAGRAALRTAFRGANADVIRAPVSGAGTRDSRIRGRLRNGNALSARSATQWR